MITELQRRLEQSQRALDEAVSAANYEDIINLLDGRAADITALVEYVSSHPKYKPWVKSFLTRDKEITAKIMKSMENYRLELEQASSKRQVHRAYLNEGTRS